MGDTVDLAGEVRKLFDMNPNGIRLEDVHAALPFRIPLGQVEVELTLLEHENFLYKGAQGIYYKFPDPPGPTWAR